MKKENKIIKDLVVYFSKRANIKFAYLFGSFGTEYQHKFSDIDIAIYVSEKKDGFRYRKLEFEIEAEISEILNDIKIDVRIINDAPIINIGKILTEGKIIYTADQNFHDNYYELALLKYMDYQIIYKPLMDFNFKNLLND